MGGKTTFCTLESHANALATNREATQVVVAGRNVFKIFGIDDSDEFVECLNLRVGKNLNLNFSCADVAWNPVEDNVLATAATNGAVVTWNLNRASRSKQDMVFQDHKRTVNKVCFHPTEPHLLLSGSQDGTMKCFDLRRREAVSTFLSLSESVRDVQFSPSPSHSCMFAAVQENGNVQLWDLRRTDRCERQFTAHHGPVFSCDWHPEEKKWLATAGRDKTIKVWDAFKPKLDYTVYTIASVARIRWRPLMKYNIASSSLVVDFSVNIWDVRRPYVPFAAFMEHKDVATGFAWRNDPNILLSTSKDCTLYQHAFRDAVRPAEHAIPIGLDISGSGDILSAMSEKISGEISGMKGSNYSSTRMPTRFRKVPSHNEQFQSAASTVTVLLNNEEKNLSMKWFVESAHHYQFTGRPLGELCDHNASVAAGLERYQTAQSWRILKVFYGGGVMLAPDSSRTLTPSASMGEGLRNADEEKGITDSQDGTNRSSRHNSGNTLHNRHFSGSKSGSRLAGGGGGSGVGNTGMPDRPVGDTSGATEDDSDISDAEHDRTLVMNVGTNLQAGDFGFFGDTTGQLLGFEYNAMSSLDGSHDWSLPSEAFQPKHPIKDCSPPPEITKAPSSPASMDDEEYEMDSAVVHSDADDQSKVLTISCIPPLPTWSFSNLVADLLHFHAAQGDVQMSVTVLLVLGNKGKDLVDENIQEQWFTAYIDLLCRFQLWNVCNQVIRSSNISVISSMNQQSTSFHMLCGNCKKQLPRVGWLCDRCKLRPASCSVCHQVVRGLFVWCQGCAHGGHLQHIKDWFLFYSVCPAGCGHLCEYT